METVIKQDYIEGKKIKTSGFDEKGIFFFFIPSRNSKKVSVAFRTSHRSFTGRQTQRWLLWMEECHNVSGNKENRLKVLTHHFLFAEVDASNI